MLATKPRLANVLHNLTPKSVWRIQDFHNWRDMVQPLRTLGSTASGWVSVQLAYDFLSRFAVSYEQRNPGPPPLRPVLHPRKAAHPNVSLFVDAPDHVSGVSTTLGNWKTHADQRGLNLSIHWSGDAGAMKNGMCFPPVGVLHLHTYDGLRLYVPRVQEVIEQVRSNKPDVIHVSTPGPMGILGLAAGRELGIPVCGTYHTDFPRYAVRLSGDPGAEAGGWRWMRWFYGQLDAICVPTMATGHDLMEHGFEPERIHVAGRGVRTDLFTPEKRDERLRQSWHPERPNKLLYVGRVSTEKNLDVLVYGFRQLLRDRDDVCLVVVGDGPYLETMKTKLQGYPVVFTGQQRGEDLQRIYASCDLFVFPSETDTYGVVLLEAQASGLPVLVAPKGGPRYGMRDGQTGFVVDPMNPEHLASRLQAVLSNPGALARMKDNARAFALTKTLDHAFEEFWSVHQKLYAVSAV